MFGKFAWISLLVFLAGSAPSPVIFTEISKIQNWWPPESIVAGIGMPGFAEETLYNYFSLSVWTFGKGPLNIAGFWSNPTKFLSIDNQFGANDSQVHSSIKKAFAKENKKLLVTAFGVAETPASDDIDPVQCALDLAKFVKNTQLDGVDINFMDQQAFQKGIAEEWLVKFTTKLRGELPTKIISHSPYAHFFDESRFQNGGYVKVNQAVGNLIDFYNVRFYDLGDSYQQYYSLFFISGPKTRLGTSVREITLKGLDLSKIVIGKPVSSKNIGFVEPGRLGNFLQSGIRDLEWGKGVMLNEYSSDLDGQQIMKVASSLVNP